MNKSTKITVEDDNRVLEYTMKNTDVSLEEWSEAFNTILTFVGYHPDTINKLLNEEI